jgi:hypothetical protein
VQPGKLKHIGWSDITCSIGFGDNLILGFGNGALASILTDGKQENCITHLDLKFSGESDMPVEKLKVINIHNKAWEN